MRVLGPGFLAAFLAAAAFTSPAFAAGEPSKCLVTVKSFQLKNGAGVWVTVAEPTDLVLDLKAEQVVFELSPEGRVAPGLYHNFKIVLSETVRVTGSDGDHHTREGGEVEITGSASRATQGPGRILSLEEKKPSVDPQTAGEMAVRVNLDYADKDDVMEIYGTKDFGTLLTVGPDSKITVGLTVPLAGTLHYAWQDALAVGVPAKEVMYFLPSGEVDEIVVQVDKASNTAVIEGQYLEWAF